MNPINPSQPVSEPAQTQYAGFWRRLLAWLVDFGILGFITISLQMALGQDPFAVFSVETLEQLEALNKSSGQQNATLISLIVGILYSITFWVYYDGATPGKKLLGIKIIKEDGKGITVPTGIIRYLGYFLSGFGLFLGYLWVAWDKKKQGWHDKIASTVVVKSGRKANIPLAIILSLIVLIIFFTYFGLAVAKGVMLGLADVKNKQKLGYTAKSSNDAILNMNPEAKIHFDNSQKLFEQMRENGTDSKKVIELNDKNIAELKLAIEKDPKNPRIWADLGSAYTWLSTVGTLEDGLAAYEKAEELDSENIVYINNVGDMLIRMEKYDEAVLQFQKTLRITENSGYANLSLGIAYQKLGVNETAATHYEKAIEIFNKQNESGSFDDEILEARKGLAAVKK